jgi:hypothetical protein
LVGGFGFPAGIRPWSRRASPPHRAKEEGLAHPRTDGATRLAGLDISVAAKALFEAPFVLISTTADDPPAVDYANQRALDAFGYTWEEMTALSAAQLATAAATVAATAAAAGEPQTFDGVFIDHAGNALPLEGVRAWPVRVKADGPVEGVALKWSLPVPEPAAVEAAAAGEEAGVEELKNKVAEQAAAVKALKVRRDEMRTVEKPRLASRPCLSRRVLTTTVRKR